MYSNSSTVPWVSEWICLVKSQMLSILSNAVFCCSPIVSPNIALTGTWYILLVCLTTQMTWVTQSAQLRRCLNGVGITTWYSWTWGRKTNWRVGLHRLELVNVGFPVRRQHWKCWIRLGAVDLQYNRANKGTCPQKVLPRLFSSAFLYWIWIVCHSGISYWMAFVYSTL